MTSSNQLKLLGSGLILGSIPLFSFFFLMLIPRLFNGVDMSLVEFLGILEIFFIGTWYFHYPAFVLIALGIYCLKKS